jgi:hypothetical protein
MVVPNSFVTYTMADSENVGDVASEYYKLVNKLTLCLPSWERKQETPTFDSNTSTFGFKRTKFREGKNGAVIDLSHLVPSPAAWNAKMRYTLNLSIYPPGSGFW